jgi:HEAT repeat protein
MRSFLRRIGWLALCIPAVAGAFEYTLQDIQTAFQRHDVRQLQSLAGLNDKALRMSALEGLMRLRDPQAVPFLVTQLQDPDPDIVQIVLWSLPSYGANASTPDVIARVDALQQNTSVDVRRTATTVAEDLRDPERLQQMHTALITAGHEQHKDGVDFYLQRKDLSILNEARDMLAGSDPFLKQTGIILVHGLDDRDRLDSVIKLLADPAPTVRAAAVLVVSDWKESAAEPLLSPMMKDPDLLVRMSVIRSLGHHLCLSNATLLSLLHDKDWEIRLSAAKALLLIPGTEATGHLIYLLDDPRKDIRVLVLQNLDQILKAPKANKTMAKHKLLKLIKDPDPDVRKLANQKGMLIR